MNCRQVHRASCLAALLAAASATRGQPPQDQAAAPTQSADAKAAAAAPEEAASIPTYSGDWFEREFLSGDWGGNRSKLAEKGLTFELGWTQITQGVVQGGRRLDWDYGGNLNMVATADMGRLGVIEGGILSIRGESRYGETVNDDAGPFTPVNTRGYFPLTEPINEGIPFTITELWYSQAIGDTLEVTVGKMLMAEGDPVEFAGGLGRTQFFNSNFIYNAATSLTAPYSTLGAAVDWTPAPWITISSALFATSDSSTTSGFDNLDDGWTWWAQAAMQYKVGGLPGGANAGFQYAFDNEFTQISGRLSLVPGGVAVPTVTTSWAVFAGGWQYLYTPDAVPEAVDASDDRADLRGVGLFARLGFADPDANPVNWSGSIGVGGRGLMPGRDNDTFGVGYFYTDVHESGIFTALGLVPHGQGCEAFYNIAVTPAVGLTLDIQWVEGGFTALDPATVLGVRLDAQF